MTPFSQWKTIGYAAAIFATGAVSGGALGMYQAKSNLFEPQHEQEIALHLKKRLETRLGLTPAQVSQIDPIVDASASEIRSIRTETAQRVGKVLGDSYSRISAILTPDQRTKLAELEKERKEMMDHWQEGRRHLGPPGDSPHDGPGPQGP